MLGAFPIIDAHAHLPLDDSSADVLDQLDIRVLNVCVDSPELGGLDAQRGWYRRLVETRPDRFAWCTSFSLDGFGSSDWAKRAIESLEADFSAGAIACKVWKNVGMDLRDPASGEFVFVDDERFEPIFEHLERTHRPLLMHIGEPMACWRPLDPESPHSGYYSANPQWHWHGRTDVPSHEALMASRDRVVERHPKLTVIGAHYGSHESELEPLPRRFDRFPNFHVDTSARLGDIALLARKDHSSVREFFIGHADRILWGVDWVLTQPASQLPEDRRRTLAASLRSHYELEWRFFATGDEVSINNRPVNGLNLPATVVSKLFVENARRIYPGID